jgi:hypothetical protein
MKRVFILLFTVAFVKFAICQDTIKPLIYTSVVKVDSGITKDQLFASARTWFNEEFKSFKDVNQIVDKETGEITIKGNIYIRYLKDGFGLPHTEWPCYTKCRISVFVKDGRYKYEFADFVDNCSSPYESASMGALTTASQGVTKGFAVKQYNKTWVETKSEVEKVVVQMIERLKVSMAKSVKKADW